MRISYIDGTLSVIGGISGELGIPKSVDTPPYEGEYEVTPRLTEQMLETQNKRMLDDVTVHEIPVTRTSNPQGGQTVLIG